MNANTPKSTSLLTRIGWLILIWSCSVGALFVVATLLRMFMSAAGMRTH